MQKDARGFTIIELLIVIVVIAILATISIVAYTGIQARARDNMTYSSVKDITKMLELYKIDHGHYPMSSYASDDANGCINDDGWSYSWSANTGTWLAPLVSSGIATTVPTPPNNTCDHYIAYSYHYQEYSNCSSYPHNGYFLQVRGAENTFIPKDTVTGGEAGPWKLCPEAYIEWWVDEETWVFYKDDA